MARRPSPSFAHMSTTARKTVASLFAAWGFLIVSGAVYEGMISVLHVSTALLLGFPVYGGSRWGQRSGILCNSVMIVTGGHKLWELAGDHSIRHPAVIIPLITMILFLLSTYYLVISEIRCPAPTNR